MLFLNNKENQWNVVNGEAGLLFGRSLDDIKISRQAYGSLSNPDIGAALRVISDEEVRFRIVADLLANPSEAHEQAIRDLFLSQSEFEQIAAITAAGRLKLAGFDTEIAALLKQQNSSSVKLHALSALGSYGNEGQLDLILEFVESQDSGLRRAAVEAAGLIGGNEILAPLNAAYAKDADLGFRLAVISSLRGVPNKGQVRQALLVLRAGEASDILRSEIDSELAGQ